MTPTLWVVDTNVVVSGVITPDPESPTGRILALMLNGRLRFILSEALLAEYREVLSRGRMIRLTGVSGAELDGIFRSLITWGVVVDVGDGPADAPDPKDDHLWQLLETHGEAGLITGDKALLSQPPVRTTVITPREWIDRFGMSV